MLWLNITYTITHTTANRILMLNTQNISRIEIQDTAIIVSCIDKTSVRINSSDFPVYVNSNADERSQVLPDIDMLGKHIWKCIHKYKG